jgi:ABC-type multidrug transport system fused ATPase/permease subunit
MVGGDRGGVGMRAQPSFIASNQAKLDQNQKVRVHVAAAAVAAAAEGNIIGGGVRAGADGGSTAQAFFISNVANRWLGVRVEFIGTCVVSLAALFAVIERHNIDPGLAGLSISYALNITGTLNWCASLLLPPLLPSPSLSLSFL